MPLDTHRVRTTATTARPSTTFDIGTGPLCTTTAVVTAAHRPEYIAGTFPYAFDDAMADRIDPQFQRCVCQSSSAPQSPLSPLSSQLLWAAQLGWTSDVVADLHTFSYMWRHLHMSRSISRESLQPVQSHPSGHISRLLRLRPVAHGQQTSPAPYYVPIAVLRR